MAPADPQRPQRFSDLRARVVSAVLLAAVAFSFIALGGIWSALLIAAMAAALVWEWRSITLHRGGACGTDAALLILAAAGGVLAAYLIAPWAGLLLLAAATAAGAALDLRAGRAEAAGWAVVGGLYLGTASVAFLWIRETDPFGVLACIWIVLVVAASDVGGYFAGRTLGGPKLWPRVSPKKTWAGLFGGMAFAFVLGGLFSWATTGTYYGEVCTVSALASLLAQGGDLCESAVKRHFGVKDSGRIFPGHGGALDRLDGLTAATLVVAAVTLWRGQTVFIWS